MSYRIVSSCAMLTAAYRRRRNMASAASMICMKSLLRWLISVHKQKQAYTTLYVRQLANASYHVGIDLKELADQMSLMLEILPRDWNSKTSVCRHELGGGSTSQTPGNSNPSPYTRTTLYVKAGTRDTTCTYGRTNGLDVRLVYIGLKFLDHNSLRWLWYKAVAVVKTDRTW